MSISISSNQKSRIFLHIFILLLAVTGWLENNHVGLNGVNFCKINSTFYFTNCLQIALSCHLVKKKVLLLS